MITPFPAGGLFNRSTMNAKLEEIGGAIKEAHRLLLEGLVHRGSMSGTWTAPDFFGDGGPYDLGVYEIGGGGSGGVAINSARGYSSTSGGASGYGKNIIIESALPNTQYSYIIGAGGTAVSISGSSENNKDGNQGGSTSFNNIETEGGDGGGSSKEDLICNGANGGQGSECCYPLGRSDIFGCCDTYTQYDSAVGGLSQSPRAGQNMFDQTMITLCAGGGSYSTTLSSDQPGSGAIMTPLPDGTKGGDGGHNKNGENATGYGNGGGGSSRKSGTSTTSGSGSDGAIFLYARRPREVTT